MTEVNPQVLIWAREERGYTPEAAAEKLKVDVGELLQWETDGKGIPFSSLDEIARLYKRQTAAFFLPAVPAKFRKPKDCRNLAGVRDLFSIETLLAIRRTSRYLDVARELSNTASWREVYKWTDDFTGKASMADKEAVAMRALLADDPNSQIHPNKPDAAYVYWRRRIEEKLGIFVFQFSMPEDEIDGFSYAFDEYPYAIVINSKFSSVRKNLTLFHELSHILRHEPGACITDAIGEDTASRIERECNNFAGKVLAPTGMLIRSIDVEEIFTIGRSFGISGEAYLRRLHEEKKITGDDFFDLLGPVREKSRSMRRPKLEKNIPIKPVIKSKASRGLKFYELVTNAAVSNRISYSSAADLLSLKASNIRV